MQLQETRKGRIELLKYSVVCNRLQIDIRTSGYELDQEPSHLKSVSYFGDALLRNGNELILRTDHIVPMGYLQHKPSGIALNGLSLCPSEQNSNLQKNWWVKILWIAYEVLHQEYGCSLHVRMPPVHPSSDKDGLKHLPALTHAFSIRGKCGNSVVARSVQLSI
jgi:hypothetical protein